MISLADRSGTWLTRRPLSHGAHAVSQDAAHSLGLAGQGDRAGHGDRRGRGGARRRPADQPRPAAGRRAGRDQGRPRRLPGRVRRPPGAAAGRPAAVGQAGAAGPAAVHAAQRVQGRAGLGAHRAGVVGGVAPRDRPGALRRPPDPAVAGQPAGRRVPRAVLPRRRRPSRPGWCSTWTRPRAPTSPSVVRAARLVRRALAESGLAGGGEDQRLEGRCTSSSPSRVRRSRTSPRPPGRWRRAPSGSTPSWPPPPTSRPTAAAGCSSTPPARARRRSWPPTARGSGPGCRCRRRWPGTRSTSVRPDDFTRDGPPGFPADVGRRAAGAAAISRTTWSPRGTPSPSRGWRRCTRASGGSGRGRRRGGLTTARFAVHSRPRVHSSAAGAAVRSVPRRTLARMTDAQIIAWLDQEDAHLAQTDPRPPAGGAVRRPAATRTTSRLRLHRRPVRSRPSRAGRRRPRRTRTPAVC